MFADTRTSTQTGLNNTVVVAVVVVILVVVAIVVVILLVIYIRRRRRRLVKNEFLINDPMLFYYFSYCSFIAFVCQPIKYLCVINYSTRISSNQLLKIIALNPAVNINFSLIIYERSCHCC